MPAGRFAPRHKKADKEAAVVRVLDGGESSYAVAKATGIPYSTVRDEVRREEERRGYRQPAPERIPDRYAETVDRILATIEAESERLERQARAKRELDSGRVKSLAAAVSELGRAITLMPKPAAKQGEAGEAEPEQAPASSLVAALEGAGPHGGDVQASTTTAPDPATAPTPTHTHREQGEQESGEGVKPSAPEAGHALAQTLGPELARMG